MKVGGMMKRFYILIFFLSVIFLNPQQSFAIEKIHSFNSEIVVYDDATMMVTERITVTAEGNKIKRGIYRDFPTQYKDRWGNNINVGFDVVSVLRDGEIELYHLKALENGKRIYIGDKDVYISHGEHVFTITYKTHRQLGFFKDHDELYWNVTGNGWDFEIDQATAVIELPDEAQNRIMEMTGYTGYQGSKGKDVQVRKDIHGRPAFYTTRALHSNEGLTIVVTWPKGILHQPMIIDKINYFIKDNQVTVYSFIFLLMLLGTYAILWYLFGVDPKKGTIIPLYHPPEKLSPALMRYIFKMGYDNKGFTAAVLNMAVKGYLKIEESSGILGMGKTYVLREYRKDVSCLSQEERAAALALLTTGSIELTNVNHTRISKAMQYLRLELKKAAEAKYFFSNQGYVAIGFLVTMIYSFLSVKFADDAGTLGLATFIMIAVAFIATFIFGYLIKAPTIGGRKLMDQIEGFKMFLSVTETDKFKISKAPEKTPELFEEYLPYALALDVEKKWAEQFSEVFKRLEQQGSTYCPMWYVGSGWSRFDSRSFASDMSGSFSSAIASSSTAPGSSSGGGGGGFSGGGGGGGGGGGW